MSILHEIVKNKKLELERFDSFTNLEDRLDDLQRSEVLPTTRGFMRTIAEAEGPALIAELKKASPSKGLIRENFDVYEIAKAYRDGGAHCFSVLTDTKYFQGSYENLIAVSSEFENPCLCKEFIVDPKQIVQARLSGADAILLIAAILDDYQLEDFANLAWEYGMDVLVEVHDEAEMKRVLNKDFELLGINNRNLETFEVSLDTTSKLLSEFKYDLGGRILVSESGIATKQDILILYNMGIKGFLVGESLMKQDDIRSAVEALLF